MEKAARPVTASVFIKKVSRAFSIVTIDLSNKDGDEEEDVCAV